ncbi:EcsC family protein [Nocardioides jejuensis]|uniref:EcsC family protein n=1 Tax=Nocardioides jejuensis TaxID=2502782 RepID=A0A4R1CGN1_9ACTN|nr:EcsC family protein [Nocardioides jejuensis]TCJ30504.1 hypothetical protein EPD65_02720 [Nocardioides jejuensis]
MGLGSTAGRTVGRKLAPRATHNFVREAMEKAIAGVGPLRPVSRTAAKKLADAHGDVEKAAHAVIRSHVAYASAQGFVTNIGGLMTAIAAIPANLAGLTLVQVRMVAAIAHVHGHDLDDPKVRAAVVATLLGEESVKKAVKKGKLPARPLALATGTDLEPALEHALSIEISSELLARMAGKRIATTAGKRIPVLGGVVGMTADGFATWQLGRFAAREFAGANVKTARQR